MKISEQWLREWVNPAVDTQALAAQITMAGLEVDGVEAVGGERTDVVVAEVSQVVPHPDADKLRVCEVFDGSQTFQVVCGARNVRAGLKVPFATIGAVLPTKNAETGETGSFTIKKAKLRGIESNGMLCSADELGIAEDSEGLLELPADAPVGTNIREYLKLDDIWFEMDLTPNRGDCLSIRGLAREIAVLNNASFSDLEVKPVAATINDT